jgi:hypothetical protein
MWSYNVFTNTWTRETSTPTPRSDFGATLGQNGPIYVIGGRNGLDTLSANEAYNPVTNTWTSESPLLSADIGPGVATMSTGAIEAIGGALRRDIMFCVIYSAPLHLCVADTWDRAHGHGVGNACGHRRAK